MVACRVAGTTVGEFAHDLLDEKWVTGSPVGDRLSQRANGRVKPEQLRNQRSSLGITQWRQGESLHVCDVG
jgi:hypothetical protein